MSTTIITIEKIAKVENHPDADRLDIIQVLGYNVIVGRDQFKIGDIIIYFPPDILIPSYVSKKLGVARYLKHAIYPGDSGKSQCRVTACRLRGIPSHGFVVSLDDWPHGMENNKNPFPDCLVGSNVTKWFDGKKYEPPIRQGAGDAEPDMPNFHRYTNIENIQRYPDMIPKGTEIVITEKIHGTNCRMGIIDGEYQAGSHKIRRKSGKGLYWQFFTKDLQKQISLLSNIHEDADVILFGEIFGPGVQDLHYGQAEKNFRAFDISIDGQYLCYDPFLHFCLALGIETVPELYRGPFDPKIVETFTYGDSTFPMSKGFKGREGCIVKPTIEQPWKNGRMILKSVSADYRNRKGAKDYE